MAKPSRSKSVNTRALYPRIAIAFDFDDTLAPDSMSSLLDQYGVDKKRYWKEYVHPRLADGWDPIPAAFYALIEISRSQKKPEKRLTRKVLAEHGKRLKFFPGVEACFNRLQKVARRSEVELEFYIISSGIGEVIRNTQLARRFKNIWASDFHYDRTGEVAYIRKVISHTEKVRYLQNISKGIEGPHGFDRPFDLNPTLPEEDVRIPLRQIIYVGDGKTDIPCFALMNLEKATAMGIFKSETAQKWGDDIDLPRSTRISNLVRPDFSAKGELAQSLKLSVEGLCKMIELRRLSIGE